ncbi:hypothetical protein CSH63_29245 [Micromonospora tulbaghiae]|uniref:Helix-turn-helix domain-containing protein n=1 Tax=Micromonospora tulbaghiae TaxID=479978 RepID=A0A386WVM7_9ACTN|nr:hypothetical protein [Micromonospora tulbaghiae]AYF31460.1 hypothetical protein CSH63_29245 [Micromonospora tulbaghiae]
MTNYDLTRLAELGRQYERQRAAAEKTRAEMMPEILAAASAKVRQVDIARASGLTRERVRQICRAAGIEPGE